jgi:sulfur carrier protein ThiS
VIANETVAGRPLIEALERRAAGEELQVTVLAPINQPRRGYVVYTDTRRAAAGRRLDRALEKLHADGISAHGLVVDADPVTTVKDALAQLEPRPDEIIVSTHPQQRSAWQRRDVVEGIRRCAGDIPVEHVVSDLSAEGETNVLVIANETVLGRQLLDRIRDRAARGKTSFLLISPQSDPTQGPSPKAEARLKRALAELRGHGIEAHGQVSHPDPFTAAMEAIEEERVDEIIVSTFEPEKSGWLRKDLIQRLRDETKLPVEHVVAAPEPQEVTT